MSYEVLRELDELVEAARLLGATQAKKLFGCYTDEDRRFERAMYESIDKHRAALLDWKAGCHCGTCTCDPNMTPSAGQTTGITATELGYALKRATPAQVIEYLEDDVDMHVALSIYFEEQHNQQPAAVAVDEAMVERACRHWYSWWDEADQATKLLWAEKMYDLLAAALGTQYQEPTT